MKKANLLATVSTILSMSACIGSVAIFAPQLTLKAQPTQIGKPSVPIEETFYLEKAEVKPEPKVDKKVEKKIEKLPVGYYSNDLTRKSNVNTLEMKEVLENAPRRTLAKYAKDFVEAEQAYGINAFVLAAIVAEESGWGTSELAKSQNNLTGFAVYNSKTRGSSFSSGGESIMLTAKLLKENYLTPNANNYHGRSIQAVNKDYCLNEAGTKTDYNWSRNIDSIANDLEEIYNGLR